MQAGRVGPGNFAVYEGPHSSTGEDVCEIHCHGSRAVIDYYSTVRQSRRLPLAAPGEFTRRSFEWKNGLSGVEGLADLIDGRTPAQLQTAWAQIDGALRTLVMAWCAELIEIAAQLEALIDFNDEDLPPVIEQTLREGTGVLITSLAKVLPMAE